LTLRETSSRFELKPSFVPSNTQLSRDLLVIACTQEQRRGVRKSELENQAAQRYFDPTSAGRSGHQPPIAMWCSAITVDFTGYDFLDHPRNYSPGFPILRHHSGERPAPEWRLDYDPLRVQIAVKKQQLPADPATAMIFPFAGTHRVRSGSCCFLIQPRNANQFAGGLGFGNPTTAAGTRPFSSV